MKVRPKYSGSPEVSGILLQAIIDQAENTQMGEIHVVFVEEPGGDNFNAVLVTSDYTSAWRLCDLLELVGAQFALGTYVVADQNETARG